MSQEMPHVALGHEVDLIIERLEQKFKEVDPMTVEDIVHQSAHYFDHAPIQLFVPLLAEKRAREQLRAHASKLPVSAA